jgi:hypothetical protein
VSRAVVLGIDPGASSGVALMDHYGVLALSGTVKKRQHQLRTRAVLSAYSLALEEKVDLVVVREMWQAGGRKMNPKTYAGMGRAWGQWFESLLVNAPLLPANRILNVYPATWKKHCGVGAKTAELSYDRQRAYISGRIGAGVARGAGEDELAAICIASYGFDVKRHEVAVENPRWLP